MNRPLLLAVLLCLSFAPPLNAKSVDCVPDSGCPKGEGPPKCCKPPPCEFFYALKRAKAELRSASMKVQGGALLTSADDYEAGWQQYKRNIRDVMRSVNSPSAKCPANQFYDPPPDLWASGRNGCRITPTLEVGSKELSLEELQEQSRSCSEIVEAEYAAAKQKQFYCNLEYQPEPDDLESFRRRSFRATQKKVDSLETSLLQYWRACSKVFSAETARSVAKAGLEALKDAKPKATPPKKQPKRSTKPAKAR